mgnify:CR=1 FL=1
MHEMTLAIQAIKSVIEFAEDNGIEKIDTVVLEIGELSLVVPEYMEDAYYAAVPHTMLAGTKLRIDTVPGNGICLDCGKVIEFSDDSIEARQREIAAKHGIRLTNHSLYLYGHCAEGDCREDEHAHEGK